MMPLGAGFVLVIIVCCTIIFYIKRVKNKTTYIKTKYKEKRIIRHYY